MARTIVMTEKIKATIRTIRMRTIPERSLQARVVWVLRPEDYSTTFKQHDLNATYSCSGN